MRLLEVCAGSIESVKSAFLGGAQRVELCCALDEDGLTPSLGMIKAAKCYDGLKIHVLIRPRPGDFVYTEDEIQCMIEDIKTCKILPVDGIVIGALTPQGEIDKETCMRLIEAAEGIPNITFHRAFDVCKNPFSALEEIISLGCNRLLTSGQAESAEKGIPVLKKLVEQANNRIVIMAGAGINPTNAKKIVQETGVTELHASARSSKMFGRLETDEGNVRKIKQELQFPLGERNF